MPIASFRGGAFSVESAGLVQALMKISVTGQVRIENGLAALDESGLPGRQGRVVLVRLAMHGAPLHREVVADALWPDGPPATWERTLSGVVSRLRSSFASVGLEDLTIENAFGCYELQRPSDAHLDIEIAAREVESAELALAVGNPDGARRAAGAAADIARRPLLAGEEGDWLDAARTNLRAILVRALNIEAAASIGTHDSVKLASEAVEVEPFRESSHVLLMRAHAAMGNNAQALLTYERCRRLLSEELGVDPGPELKQAYEEVLRADQRWIQPRLPPPFVGASEIFVGRDAILRRLDAIWNGTDGCKGVLIGGEPGVGKSRVVTELVLRAHTDGATVLYGRTDEDGGAPFQPFAEALRELVLSAAPGAVRGRGGRLASELVRIVPQLPDVIDGVQPPTSAEPETERYLLFEAVATLLRAVSQDAPVLIVLEDLHWADKPTLSLLRRLLRIPDAGRLLICGTFRDDELDGAGPLSELIGDAAREGNIETIALPGLDEQGVESYVEIAAGHELDERGRDFARIVHHETRGNCFFIRELLSHLAETGVLEQREGRWTSDRALAEIEMPPTVREVVKRRLARLSEDARELLSVGSVIGQAFALDVAEAALSGRDLLAALEETTAGGLITDDGSGRWAFVHALVRRVTYDSLSTARRRRLHRRVGEVLVAADRPDYESIVHHYLEANAEVPAGKRAECALAAGRAAIEAVAFERAYKHFEAGLDVIAGEPDEHHAVRSKLYRYLGIAKWRGAGENAPHEVMESAAEARRAGSVELLVETLGAIGSRFGRPHPELLDLFEGVLVATAGERSATRALLLADMAAFLFAAYRDRRRASTLAGEALEIARELGEPWLLRFALTTNAFTLRGTSRFEDEDRVLSEAAAMDVEAGRDPGRRALGDYGQYGVPALAAIAAGQIGDRRRFERFVRTYGADPPDLFFGEALATAALTLDGRFAEAEARALEISRTQRETDRRLIGLVQALFIWRETGRQAEMYELLAGAAASEPEFLGLRAAKAICAAEAGRIEDAQTELDALMANDLALVPDDVALPSSLAMLAEAALILGDKAAAARLLDRLLPFSGMIVSFQSFVGFFGAADRFIAGLLDALGRHEEAEPLFVAAIELEDRFRSPPLAARTKVAFARMLGSRGDVDRASTLLKEGLATAEKLGMNALAAQAQSLLADVHRAAS